MKCSILVRTVAAFFVIITPAFAYGLTDADYAYLLTQKVERSRSILSGLSPKELTRLHALINDKKTENDPAARDKAVNEALMEFIANQRWEEMHPGQLWDSQKRSNY